MNSEPLTLVIPSELIERIAERAAELVRQGEPRRDPRGRANSGGWPEWLSVETAAAYLDVSPERVRKLQARGELPFYQEGPGCRVLFRRLELDEAMSRWRQR